MISSYICNFEQGIQTFLALYSKHMNRKRTNFSPQYRILQSINSMRIASHNQHHKQIEISLYITQQQPPLSIIVPAGCNMKILKSILYYNLKQELPSAQFNKIIGFQSFPANHEVDYQLQQGIGVLLQGINLICVQQSLKYHPNSLLNYKICKLLAVGGFSKVYLLRNLKTGDFEAGKFMLKQNANMHLIQNQYSLASNLDHPFIVKTTRFFETQHFYVMIMEFLPGGQLFNLLKVHRQMSEEQARFYLVETILALKYLHQQNIIYRDIKPENIIIDQSGHIKLTDFGLAKKTREKAFSFCGSLDYMAPEILEKGGYSYQIDYYSIGNLLFEILVGSPPFYHPNYTPQQTKHHIMHSVVKFTEGMRLSPAAIDLLTKLLEKKPEDRLGYNRGIEQILEHQWFKNVNLHHYQQKLVDPPIKVQIKFLEVKDETLQEQNKWKSMIEEDIKKLKIKAQFSSQKSMRINYKIRKSFDQFQRYSTSQKRSQSKLKSNLSLLFVMTQKRSNSVAPSKKCLKSSLTKSLSKNSGAFKSLELSRKQSFCGFPESKQTKCTPLFKRQTSHPELSSNFVLTFNKKNKENVNSLMKRSKQHNPNLKFTK